MYIDKNKEEDEKNHELSYEVPACLPGELGQRERRKRREIMKKTNRVIILTVGLMIMFLSGTVYAWSIISRSISATFPSWNAQTLSMTFTLTMMFYALGGLVSGFILKKTGPRPVLTAAALLYPSGMVIASFAQSPVLLYLGFGAMCGLATGLCYNSAVSTVSAWFPDMQGAASSSLLAAYGLSSFISGKLFAAFAPADGGRAWAMGLRLLAVLLLAAIMTGIAVFRFPKDGELTVDASQKKGHREPASDLSPSQMLRTSSFWLYYVWVALLTGAGLILVGQASGIAEEVGRNLSGNTIATVVGMISIMNAIGRICNGTVFDRYGYHGTMTMVLSTFTFSAITMLLAYQTGFFPLLVIGFMTGGFAYGAFCSTSPALMADFYGRTWYSINFSIIPTNTLFTSFATVIAGRLYDITNSFYSSILLLFAFVIVSVFLAFVIKRPGEHKVTERHHFRHHRVQMAH